MEERRRINMGRGKSKERKGIMKGKNDLKTEQLETKKKKISVQNSKIVKRTSQFLFPPSISISIFRPNLQLLVQGEHTFPFYHPSTVPVDSKSPTRHHHSNVNRLIHGYTRVELRCQRQSWTSFSKVAALGPCMCAVRKLLILFDREIAR